MDIVVAIQKHLYQVISERSNTQAPSAWRRSIVIFNAPLISQCLQPHQLPALYLVDMIIKTIGEPYVEHFGPALPYIRSKLKVSSWVDMYR